MILTYDEAVEQLHLAVKLKGEDHRAAECEIYDAQHFQFSQEKTPVCIVGQVLYQLVGHKEFQNVKQGTVRHPLESLNIAANSDALDVLDRAQKYQDGAITFDGNEPWGKAVEFAIKEVANV